MMISLDSQPEPLSPRGISRELKLFAIASLAMGMAYSIVDATFNNFLNDRFALGGFERSFLEFPRELPGFLVVFVSAALWFLCSRRLGGVALLLGVAGSLLIGFASTSYAVMVVWLFIYSMGQHLFMPIAATIGMELAEEGKTGRRLGQLNALRNLAAIAGSFLVFLGFRFLGFTFEVTFVLAAIGFVIAAVLMFRMQPQTTHQPRAYLTLRHEYALYYVLVALAGSRKQLFITFAPWVIVSIFNQPTQTIATLMTIGGVIGILFQPLLGRWIDRLGERTVLLVEAVLLAVVCFGYGFARAVLPEEIAFLAVCLFYLLDQMLFSVGMARSMYMKKIARDPGDVQAALTAGVTIDHIFSIGVALVGGAIWSAFGFEYVFLMGVVIAVLSFFAARRVRLPDRSFALSPTPAR
ncbi:MAG: MFS transporter [Anaerolineae bacterium]|nr:MFS transporter [Thermoflexales bacterium]MDW8408533.1 MFS transporter [Anaerolineae bacterium]